MSKIYVGNLPFSADEEAVRALFSQHGTVDSVALIKDRDTGQFRGGGGGGGGPRRSGGGGGGGRW
jgi:RNA recognition motif-containing protein